MMKPTSLELSGSRKTQRLQLPVRDSSNDVNFLEPREDSGRKMRCFRNNKGICETGLLCNDVMLDII